MNEQNHVAAQDSINEAIALLAMLIKTDFSDCDETAANGIRATLERIKEHLADAGILAPD